MSRRRRVFFKVLGYTLALVLLALGLEFTLQRQGVRGWLARSLESQLEAATGEDVSLASTKLGLFPLRLDVEGIQIRHQGTGQLAFGANRLLATFGPRSQGFGLRTLVLEQPVLSLHVEKGQIQEFPGLRWYAGDRPTSLPWKQLEVEGGAVEINQAGEVPTRVSASGVDIFPGAARRSTVSMARLSLERGEFSQVAEGVRIKGATFGPHDIILRDIQLAFPLAELSGSFGLGLRSGGLSGDLQIQIQGEAVSALMDPHRMEGVVQADLSVSGDLNNPRFSGSLLTSPTLDLLLEDRRKRIDLEEVVGSVTLDKTGVDLRGVTLVWPVPLRLDMHMEWDTQVDSFWLQGESVSAAEIWNRSKENGRSFLDLDADVEISMTGALNPLLLEGHVYVAGADFIARTGPLEDETSETILVAERSTLEGALSLDEGGLLLEGASLVLGRSQGSARADIRWKDTVTMDYRVDIDPLDLSDLRPVANLDLRGTGALHAWVRGPPRAMTGGGEVVVHQLEVLGIPFADLAKSEIVMDPLQSLEFRGFRAWAGESLFQGNLHFLLEEPVQMEVDLLLEDGRISDLAGIFLDLPGLEGRVAGTLSLAGEPLALDGEALLELRDVDLYGERFSTGEVRGRMTGGIFTLERLLVQRRGGAESLLARGRIGRGWAMNLDLLSDGLTVEGLDWMTGKGGLVSGSLFLDARIGGTLMAPEPRGRLAMDGTRLLGEPAGPSNFVFSTREGRLRYEGGLVGMTAWVEGDLALDTSWAYALSGGMEELPLHLLYPVAADGREVRGAVTGTFASSGQLFSALERGQGHWELDLVELGWGEHLLRNEQPWRYDRDGSHLRLADGSLAGGSTRLVFSGESREGQLAFRGSGRVDLGLIQAFTDEISRAEGVGDLSFALEGPRGDAVPRLVLDLEDATLRTPYFRHLFEEVSGRVSISPGGYALEDIRARVGGGRVRGGGEIEAEHYVPKRYELQASLTDGRVRYLDFLPAMEGNARLRFDGPLDSLLLSGDIEIESMLFSDPVRWEEWVLDIREGQLVEVKEVEDKGLFALDLHATSEGGAVVRNNIAEGQCDVDLRIVGDTARPGMLGWVRMQPDGRFFLQDRVFEVARAELLYTDPWSYDPQVDILLNTDIRSREDSYRINYRVEGPFSDWNSVATSEPALSQADINALLLFGVTREELEQVGGVNTALLVEGADILLHGVGLEERVRQGSGGIVDRVQLVTGVSERGTVAISEPRILMEKRLGEPYDMDLIWELSPVQSFDSYLAVEKQIAENFYVSFFHASEEQDRSLEIGGAYGADFKFRLERD